jgi:hypothetical protein
MGRRHISTTMLGFTWMAWRLMGRDEPIAWPPRLPDLIPWDIFVRLSEDIVSHSLTHGAAPSEEGANWSYSRIFQHFMEPGGSLLCSQESPPPPTLVTEALRPKRLYLARSLPMKPISLILRHYTDKPRSPALIKCSLWSSNPRRNAPAYI